MTTRRLRGRDTVGVGGKSEMEVRPAEPNLVSVIIPARNEQYLQRTIDDLLSKAKGDVEIIPILDGYWPDPPLTSHPSVHILYRGVSLGLRNAVNSGAQMARG